MRFLFAAALLIQSAPAPTQAERIEAALKKMTDREYRVFFGGQDQGTVTMMHRIETEGGRKVGVFEFIGRMTRDGKTEERSLTVKADLDGLRFLSAKSVGPGGKAGRALEVKDGKVAIEDVMDETTKLVEVTASTVEESTLLRLPGVLEQKVGSARKVDVLDFFTLGKDYELKCLERTTLELAGAKHEVFKWQLSGRDFSPPGPPEGGKVVHTYWVSPEGVLLRYTMDVNDNKNVKVLELKAK